jgi:hypothetical protein
MEQSSGRIEAPTTETGGPDARALEAQAIEEEIRSRVRDVAPAAAYDDTSPLKASELRRAADPLDPRRPSRETDDPLDPGSHVI